MTRPQIKNELYRILLNTGIDSNAITERASFQKDLGLDSLDFAELILLFEIHFSLEIPVLEAEQIDTIKGAIDLIQELYSITRSIN